VNIYPVGLFQEILVSWHRKEWHLQPGSLVDYIRGKAWRSVWYYFRGFRADPDLYPGRLTTPGWGWTRKAALRNLQRKVNRKAY